MNALDKYFIAIREIKTAFGIDKFKHELENYTNYKWTTEDEIYPLLVKTDYGIERFEKVNHWSISEYSIYSSDKKTILLKNRLRKDKFEFYVEDNFTKSLRNKR